MNLLRRSVLPQICVAQHGTAQPLMDLFLPPMHCIQQVRKNSSDQLSLPLVVRNISIFLRQMLCFSLESLIYLSLTRCVFQIPIELLLIIFSLKNQWPILEPNQWLKSSWLDLCILLKFNKKISAPTPSALRTYTRAGPTGLNLVHVF